MALPGGGRRRLGCREWPAHDVLLARSPTHPAARVAETSTLIGPLSGHIVYVHGEYNRGRHREGPLRQGHSLSSRSGADALPLVRRVDGETAKDDMWLSRGPDVVISAVRLKHSNAHYLWRVESPKEDREGPPCWVMPRLLEHSRGWHREISLVWRDVDACQAGEYVRACGFDQFVEEHDAHVQLRTHRGTLRGEGVGKLGLAQHPDLPHSVRVSARGSAAIRAIMPVLTSQPGCKRESAFGRARAISRTSWPAPWPPRLVARARTS